MKCPRCNPQKCGECGQLESQHYNSEKDGMVCDDNFNLGINHSFRKFKQRRNHSYFAVT